MTWLLLGFMNFNGLAFVVDFSWKSGETTRWNFLPQPFSEPISGVHFVTPSAKTYTFFARWIHGIHSASSLFAGSWYFPSSNFFAEKKSGEQGIFFPCSPDCLGYISEQWMLGICNLQDAITLVRAVVTDLERDPNGDSYEGEFKNGKKHGNGKMLWDDGQL